MVFIYNTCPSVPKPLESGENNGVSCYANEVTFGPHTKAVWLSIGANLVSKLELSIPPPDFQSLRLNKSLLASDLVNRDYVMEAS